MKPTKNTDKEAELLQDIYANVKMGSESIINIMPRVNNSEMKAEMTAQLNEYEKYAALAKKKLDSKGVAAKEESMMTKMSAKMGMNMQTMIDSSSSHIAEMMVQGSTMDVTDLLQKVSAYSRYSECDDAIAFAKDIVSFEEKNVEKMKQFL